MSALTKEYLETAYKEHVEECKEYDEKPDSYEEHAEMLRDPRTGVEKYLKRLKQRSPTLRETREALKEKSEEPPKDTPEDSTGKRLEDRRIELEKELRYLYEEITEEMLKRYGTPEYFRIRNNLLGIHMSMSELARYAEKSYDNTEAIAEEIRTKLLSECCNNSNDDKCYGRC